MTMVKMYNPVQKSINNLFDEFFNEMPSINKTVNKLFAPAVNIVETADAYHLELMAPGRNKEDFSIAVDKEVLTVGFEAKEEKNQNDYKVIRKEFSYQSFKRSFTLDEKINAEAIQAKYENGLLKLYLPKKTEVAQPVKTITIQ
jgi:HSP20 family protein